MSKIYCDLELNTLNFHSELAGAKVALEDFNAANAEIIERKIRPSRWSRLWSRVAGFFGDSAPPPACLSRQIPRPTEDTETRLRRRIKARDEQIELLRDRVQRETLESAQCRAALQEQKNLQSLTEMGALRLKQSVEQLRGEVTSLRNRSNHFREAYEVKICEVGALTAEIRTLQDALCDVVRGE